MATVSATFIVEVDHDEDSKDKYIRIIDTLTREEFIFKGEKLSSFVNFLEYIFIKREETKNEN